MSRTDFFLFFFCVLPKSGLFFNEVRAFSVPPADCEEETNSSISVKLIIGETMYQLIGSCSLSLAFFLFSFPCCLSFSKLFARTPQDAVKWFLFFPLSFFLFLPLDLFSRRPAAGIPLVRAVCSGWAQCHVKHLGKPHILCVATIWRYSRETDASSERERQAGVCYTDTTHTYTRDDVTVQSRSHLSILSLRFTWRLSLSIALFGPQ